MQTGSLVKTSTSSTDTESDSAATTACIDITKPSDFYKMTSGSSGKIKHYCIKNDIDFLGDGPTTASDLRSISLDGQGHKIFGVKFSSSQSLFASLTDSTVKNLSLGDIATSNSLLISSKPTGILAHSVSNSTIENITVINPVTINDSSNNKNCGVLFYDVNNSNIENVLLNLNSDLNFSCEVFGLVSLSIDHQKSGKLSNIQILNTSKIEISNVHVAGLVAAYGYVYDAQSILINVNNLIVHGINSTQNGFGAFMGSNYFSNPANPVISVDDISVQGVIHLENINFAGGLIADCGGITDSSKSISIQNFNIDMDLNLDNHASLWSAGNPVGNICGLIYGPKEISLSGTVNSAMNIIGVTTTPQQMYVGGYLGIATVGKVSLQILDTSLIEIHTPANQASLIHKGKYSSSGTVPAAPTGAELLQVLYNSTLLE